MELHEIVIEWEGPLSVQEVIANKTDGGEEPEWDGNDYGLYQIYGKHILCGPDTLLYVGKTTEQTFSDRINQHYHDFLKNEEGIQVYLGRVFDSDRHSPRDNWRQWYRDIDIAERIMIYKYCPNYNSQGIGDRPPINDKRKIKLFHKGAKHRLEEVDIAPDDF